MSSSGRRHCFCAFAIAFIGTQACGTSDKAGRQPLVAPAAEAPQSGADNQNALPLAAIAALDAGNAAYRERKFADALVRYREAATAAPNHAAPWFGLYMVATELKNTVLADSAMKRVKALSTDPAALSAHAEVSNAPSMGVPGSALPGHPQTKALPPGHPATQQLPPGHPAPGTPPAPAKSGPTGQRGSLPQSLR